jgi:hypothetical protein
MDKNVTTPDLHPVVLAWLEDDEEPGWTLDDPEVLRRIREAEFLELHDRWADVLPTQEG